MKVTLRKYLLEQQKSLNNLVAGIADELADNELDETIKRELNLELKSIQRELNLINDIFKICVDRKYY